MAERGNMRNKFLDRYLGIPLTLPVTLWRWVEGFFLPRKKIPAKIALLSMGAIGDTLLLSGLVDGIKNLPHKTTIDIYCTPGNQSAANLMTGLNNVYAYPLSKLHNMIGKLRSKQYDLLIDTSQWARIGAIISGLSRAVITVGFQTPGQYRAAPYNRTVPHSNVSHEWVNFLNLGRAVFPQLRGTPGIMAPYLQENVVIPKEPFIIFHMFPSGSNVEERCWPPEKWAELAVILINQGFSIALSGSPDDAAACRNFVKTYMALPYRKEIAILAGRYTFYEFAEILPFAAAMVSVNTGTMHLAALEGVPTLGLHGPTNPLRWGPVGERARSVKPVGAKHFLNLGFEKMPDDRSYCRHVEVETVVAALDNMGLFDEKK